MPPRSRLRRAWRVPSPGSIPSTAARPRGARRRRQAAAPTIAAPIRSQPRSSRSRIARTARRTDPAVAEVTLTDGLQYGVQAFLTSKDVGLGNDKGSVGLLGAGQVAAQSALLQRVAPGLNLVLGSENQPRVILNALSNITDVQVLSSPSIVALDNKPPPLQVGDEIPITTSSAAVLANSAAPIVNTIQMRNTGVILKVLPHINANGSILLEGDQEISNLVTEEKKRLTRHIA